MMNETELKTQLVHHKNIWFGNFGHTKTRNYANCNIKQTERKEDSRSQEDPQNIDCLTTN